MCSFCIRCSPVDSHSGLKDVASAVSVDSCLEDGWAPIARLIPRADNNMTVKANAFLASLSRIDDSRMLSKYKTAESSSTKYIVECYSVAEREKMMGLPAGYVEKPLCHLFHELTTKAFLRPEMSKGKTYRDFLPRELWHFRKQCNFKFHAHDEDPFFKIAISSPLEGKSQLAFYTHEQYCKHLLGNGWSIPVIEHLLGRLPSLFDNNALKRYDGYTYNFPWEPYASMKSG
jgi:hypothetical protein